LRENSILMTHNSGVFPRTAAKFTKGLVWIAVTYI